MPLSQVATTLLSKDKLNWGDPCYQADWNSTIDACKAKGHLAKLVFDHYGITYTNAPSNDWTSCCPLDLLNQDPFACIKMSLQAMLLSDQYWEVYADEFGRARFIQLLNGSNVGPETIQLKNIQYCIPTIQTQDQADMVVVRAAQPPPYRRCGSDWFTIVDPAMYISTTTIRDLGGVFPMGNNPAQGSLPPRASSTFGPVSLQGMKFTWGHVNGHESSTTDTTCDHGVFAQFGTVIYPDFQRKQSYKDEYVDVAEVEGYETILFWLIDVDYGIGENLLKHYNVQFTKSSEMPVYLTVNKSDDLSDYFGPMCDLGQGTSSEIKTYLSLDMGSNNDTESSCDDIETASKRGREGKDRGTLYWDEYSLPAYFGYAIAHSKMNFLDISKWSVGSNLCVDDQFADNMYESTVGIMGNGCTLEGFAKAGRTGYGEDFLDIGWQKERRTFDIPQSSIWAEVPYNLVTQGEHGNLYYALRSKAPDVGTQGYNNLTTGYKWYWRNPYHQLMLEWVGCRWQGGTDSALSVMRNPCGSRALPFIDGAPWMATYKPPGHLLGMDEGLYTMDEFWAKVSIARPGVVVKGLGKSVDTFLNNFTLRALPVYQVDFPAPTVAAGGEFGAAGFKVNPDNDLFDNMYCTVEDKTTDTEKLQEAMTGNVVEITFPFLFPHVETGNSEYPREAFDRVTNQCLQVARNLWGYLDSYTNMPYKNMTFICLPPSTQEDIPFLGQTVQTDHGPRTINSISFSYSDIGNYTMTVEVGPVSVTQAAAGTISRKRTKTEDVRGRIVSHEYGALYKVDIPGIGTVKAWNIDHWPWNAGDRVTVQLYNNPQEA